MEAANRGSSPQNEPVETAGVNTANDLRQVDPGPAGGDSLDNSQPFTASELGLYQECIEPIPTSSQPSSGGEAAAPLEHWRGWLGLQHATESQTQAALGSLDLSEVGEPTLPTHQGASDQEHASMATTVPWCAPSHGGTTAAGLGNSARATQADTDAGGDSESAESVQSHRRRRAHATCD